MTWKFRDCAEHRVVGILKNGKTFTEQVRPAVTRANEKILEHQSPDTARKLCDELRDAIRKNSVVSPEISRVGTEEPERVLPVYVRERVVGLARSKCHQR